MVSQQKYYYSGTREMECEPFDGGEDGEYKGARLVEISNILVIQGDFIFFENAPFDKLEYRIRLLG